MKKASFTPAVIASYCLYALTALLAVGIVVGGYFMHRTLDNFATEVDHIQIDAELSQQSIENLRQLEKALDDNRDSVERASAIVADTKYYEYQNQIVEDVNSYAAASGLTVLGFDFTNAGKAPAPSASGTKTIVATVNLQAPVRYDNYLRFLRLIERNLTKMQITQLDISNDLKTPGMISSPSVTLEVYVR